MKKILLFILILPSLVFTACDTMEDPEIEYAPTWPISGEWYVRFETETAPNQWEDVYGSYLKILTYNTAANTKDTVWIDDLNNVWSFKVKCPIVVSNKTFGMADSALNNDTAYPIKVIVKGGFVSLGTAKSISGVKTDSIYFTIGFSDDPGTAYRLSGHRRTGFIEDEVE